MNGLRLSASLMAIFKPTIEVVQFPEGSFGSPLHGVTMGGMGARETYGSTMALINSYSAGHDN